MENQAPQNPINNPIINDPIEASTTLRAVKNTNETYLDSSRIPYWDETQKLIHELEKQFNGRVVVLYIPTGARLTEDEIKEMYYHIEKIGRGEELYLFLYGPGGSGITAYKIVNLLRSYYDKLIVIAPQIAASAMTMLTLGADEILTGPLSSFTPIDTSISNHPLAPKDKDGYPVSVEIQEVQKYLEFVKSEEFEKNGSFEDSVYRSLSKKIHPLLLGTIQRSLSLSKLLTAGILKTHMKDEEKINNLVNALNDQYPIHSYPILKKDLLNFGLNINDLTKEQNYISNDLLNYYASLEYSNVKDGNKRKILRRQAFIESIGLRSYFLSETEEELINGKWTKIGGSGQYLHAIIALNRKGFKQVTVASTKDFSKWRKGEVVEID